MNSRDYNKKYYNKNKKRISKKARLYALTHKKERKAWHKAWAEKHPKEILANKAKFRIVHRKVTAKSLRLAIEILEKILITIE